MNIAEDPNSISMKRVAHTDQQHAVHARGDTSLESLVCLHSHITQASAKCEMGSVRESSLPLSAFASVTVYGCSDTLRLLWATPWAWPGELRGEGPGASLTVVSSVVSRPKRFTTSSALSARSSINIMMASPMLYVMRLIIIHHSHTMTHATVTSATD